LLLRLATLGCLLWPAIASAAAPVPVGVGTDNTRASLDRLAEILDLRIQDGQIAREEVMPAILVSARPRYESSASWFPTRAMEILVQAFGSSGLRSCEACMAPRAFVAEGTLQYATGALSLDEIVRLDEASRGPSQAARTAIWLDEVQGGVSMRIVDLRTARVVFAKNVDPYFAEQTNTARQYTLSEELERRARGDSITQVFVDAAVYPGQHLSVDWTDQWGADNKNLSGVVLSVYDPIIGIGAVHYRVLDPLHMTVGGKLVMSLPTAIVRITGETPENIEELDPLLTLAGVLRVPFGRSNFGGLFTVSTNGEVGFGISLLNISIIPVIP
jgi:hypothetical protein